MRRLVILLALLPVILSVATPICKNGYSLVNNKCLRLFTNPLVHKDAVATCTSNYGTLTTVKNAIDNRALTTFVGTAVKHIWIGLYCFQSDTSNCLWDDATGNAVDYSSFAKSFPYTDVGNCVYYSVSGTLAGQWVSGDCDDDLRPFVCEIPVTYQDSCNYNFNGYCYFPSYTLPVFEKQNFESAESVCESMCGNLVSIHSPNEIRFVKSLFSSSYQNILIGALTVAGKYHSWADGSAWNYNNFDSTSKQPGNCMMMSLQTSGNITQDAWYPTDCLASKSFLCKRPTGTQCNDFATITTTEAPYTDVSNTPDPSYNQDCNRFIMAPAAFTSPGYPGNYFNNLNCSFSLATLGAYKIRLAFNTFNTEGCCDKVRIYDGDSADAPMLNQLSGQPTTPFYYQSSGNTMFVTFTTDGSVVTQGFSANFLSLI